VQERHVGELGEGGVRFASTPLRPNLSTSRLHTSRSASRFRYAALSTEFGYESLHCPDLDRIAIGSGSRKLQERNSHDKFLCFEKLDIISGRLKASHGASSCRSK
jgi:hypothetical protein